MHRDASVVCLHRQDRLMAADRQKHHAFPFAVPEGASELRIRFHYGPGAYGAYHNLLTLTLFDPAGFRGAGHRRQVEQELVIGHEAATPGFYPGPILPGEWMVEIEAHEIGRDGEEDAGCHYELTVEVLQDDQTAGLGPTVVDPRERPPGPATIHDRPGWYKGDLHCHSLHCDGQSTPAEMARAAVARDLDFLGLTSHNTLSWLRLDEDWPAELLPIRGIECTTFFGHANAWGIREWVDWRANGRGFAAGFLQDEVARQGGLFSINHPCAIGNPHCTGCQWDYVGVDYGRVDCLEVWNGRWRFFGNYNESALQLWTDLLNAGYRMTAVAGTDNHEAEQYQAEDLPFTYVYADGLGEEAILSAVRRGRVFLSSGPELTFTARTATGIEASLPGEALPALETVFLAASVHSLEVQATLWLIGDGRPVASRAISGPADTITFEPFGFDGWCRLELRQGEKLSGDVLALTNPIYRA